MKNYLQFGTDVAEHAGSIMLKYFNTGLKSELKADKTPVTEADITINKMVIESILKEYPTYGILGEEESFMQESEYIWVCDPIDGTIPFTHAIPLFTFSLALTHKGDPVVGIVYDPVMKRMYTAEKGKGAYLNGNKICVSETADFDRQLFGFQGRISTAFNQEEFRKSLFTKGIIFNSFGSATYTCVMVALGEFIGSLYTNIHPWDCAAVKLIVDEAGGKTSDLYGNEQRYDKSVKGFIATNALVHKQIVELAKRCLT